MSQHIMNEIFNLVCYDGIQFKKWEQCKDLDSQLQFIRDAIPIKLNEASKNQDYEALEKQVQKYENEIRKHIRMEQQIKLYAESLQQKLEEVQNKEEMGSNKLLNSLKKENQVLCDQVKKLQSENQLLKMAILQDQDNDESPTQDRSRRNEQIQLKSTSKYSTIDSQLPRSRRYSKVQEDIGKYQTQISNTIDSSILKMYQNKRDSIKGDGSYKSSSRDNTVTDKGESVKAKNIVQQRTVQSQQKNYNKLFDCNGSQVKTTENSKFDLKSQKVSENYKQFLLTYNILCQKSKTNSRQDNRQKCTSEHTEKQSSRDTNKQGRAYSRQNDKVRHSQDYQDYLEKEL